MEKKKVAKKAKTAPQEVKITIEHQTTPALVPEFSQALIEPEKQGSKLMLPTSWLSDKQALKVLQKTPANHIYTRKGKGGKDFQYVTGNYVKKVLNFGTSYT